MPGLDGVWIDDNLDIEGTGCFGVRTSEGHDIFTRDQYSTRLYYKNLFFIQTVDESIDFLITFHRLVDINLMPGSIDKYRL